MQEKIFQNIIIKNIISNNLIIHKKKELQLIFKINNLHTKFKFFKYNMYLKNQNILNVFCKSQKIYYLVTLFSNKLKTKIAKIYNNEDIFGNTLNDNTSFNVLIDKFIYKFTYVELINIIKMNLLNFQSQPDNYHTTNNFSTPLEIKNPYTNINLKKYILYNFYIFCKNNSYKIPTIFQLYYESNFVLNDFFILHENYITLKSIRKYIISAENEDKYKYILKSSIIFSDFLIDHLNNSTIKYLCAIFKNKIYNLDINFLDNNFDEIIYYYMTLIYYYNSNNSKNFVCYKIKLIFALLNNKVIKFIDKNSHIPNITIKIIETLINDKINQIVLKEITNYRLINNLDIIISNLNYNNNEIINNNQEITNNNQEIKHQNTLITLFKNEIFNNKFSKFFFKIITFNIFIFNCYINIILIKKIYLKLL
tara:strand:+ start:3469 stop:4737 length:1269 start_codon:yes stop_codon:yes gene_type:complete